MKPQDCAQINMMAMEFRKKIKTRIAMHCNGPDGRSPNEPRGEKMTVRIATTYTR